MRYRELAGFFLVVLLALATPVRKVTSIQNLGTHGSTKLPKHKAVSVSASSVEIAQSPLCNPAPPAATAPALDIKADYEFQYENIFKEILTPPPR